MYTYNYKMYFFITSSKVEVRWQSIYLFEGEFFFEVSSDWVWWDLLWILFEILTLLILNEVDLRKFYKIIAFKNCIMGYL